MITIWSTVDYESFEEILSWFKANDILVKVHNYPMKNVDKFELNKPTVFQVEDVNELILFRLKYSDFIEQGRLWILPQDYQLNFLRDQVVVND